MTWVDLVVLGILAISAILAFLRGFVREVLGIAAWAGAAFVAVWFFDPLRPLIERLVEGWFGNLAGWIVDWIAAAGLFVVSVFVLMLVARRLSAMTRGLGLGALDRTLGMLFGLARGGAVVISVYILCGIVTPIEQWPEPVLRARLLDSVYTGAKWSVEHLVPPTMNIPPIYPPPGARQATAQDLFRAAPYGTPIGRPITKPPARD